MEMGTSSHCTYMAIISHGSILCYYALDYYVAVTFIYEVYLAPNLPNQASWTLAAV